MNDIPKIAFGKLGTFMDYVFHSPDWAVVVALDVGLGGDNGAYIEDLIDDDNKEEA